MLLDRRDEFPPRFLELQETVEVVRIAPTLQCVSNELRILAKYFEV